MNHFDRLWRIFFYSTSVVTVLFFVTCVAAMPYEHPQKNHFKVVSLGTSGGEFQDNLSSYLVAPIHSNQWVGLDAGTLCSGVNVIPTQELKRLKIASPKEWFTQNIKAYLISHAHLDHINGLVICSTIDSHKEILGINTTIEYIRDNIFNWKIWPNFGDEGKEPLLRKYHYHRLSFGKKEAIPHTAFFVKAFPLNHGNGYPSTAFLLGHDNHYLLYLGDTGADKVEHSHNINQIWQDVAPLIREHKLSALFIESSYSNERPDALLFGHLKPQWVLDELHELAHVVDPRGAKRALSGLNVIVTHVKQGFEKQKNAQEIIRELNEKNNLGVKFVLPKQGTLMIF